jgi:hypothetical protein
VTSEGSWEVDGGGAGPMVDVAELAGSVVVVCAIGEVDDVDEAIGVDRDG